MFHDAIFRIRNTGARVQSQTNQRGICGGTSGTAKGFSPSNWKLPYQYHSTENP